jgi:hypothetical protein
LRHLGNSIAVGVLVGLLLGFVDTYGYAVTGYTTAELSPIIAAILVLTSYRFLFRRKPSTIEHFLGVVIASGISLSTTITSGMYVTYTMLSRVAHPAEIGLPPWTFYKPYIDLGTMSFYVYATAISATGAILAYAFHKHFLEKEKLTYPIGTAVAMTVEIGRILKRKNIVIPITLGIVLEVIIMYYNVPSVDPTPAIQSIVPGASIAVALDILVILLALLIPLNTSIGVGIGNLITYSILTPLFVYQGLLITLPTMGAQEVAVAAAPYISSVLVGFIIVSSIYYAIVSRKAFIYTFKYFAVARGLIKTLILGMGFMASLVVPLVVLYKPPVTLLVAIPGILALHLFITLVTIRVVGETGTASQSTLPIATITLYAAGARGSIPYILLDPFTGVPMPQFIAGSATNLMKGGKVLDIDAETVAYWLIIAMLLGAPITLLYGHGLLSVYGLSSPKLNLLRWLPIVVWMRTLYSGDISSFCVEAILIGLITAITLLGVLKFFKVSAISLFAIMLGLTLTPDLGVLFLLAALIKYVALRIGMEVYESLLSYAALMLAGAGLGIALSVTLSFAGVL